MIFAPCTLEMAEAWHSDLAEPLEKSTGTKIRVSLIAGITCGRGVPLRAAGTEEPLRSPILREELLSPTAAADGLPELFMFQDPLAGRLFAPRELAIIGLILPLNPPLAD